MQIPRVEHPEKYAGLFVYDFGEHTALGYTIEEVRLLRRHPDFMGGQAYHIYRVDDLGRFELEGISDRRLESTDGMIFRYPTLQDARTDCSKLRAAADRIPLSFAAETWLAELNADPLPALLVLSYPSHASGRAARWLGRIDFQGGEDAVGGRAALASLQQQNPTISERRELPRDPLFTPRGMERLIAEATMPVQRHLG